MGLPCVKFVTFTTSYIAFVVLLVLSSLRVEQRDLDEGRFSELYNESYEKYLIYHENENLTYKFFPKDFYIRSTTPSSIDIVVCIWLLGLIYLGLYVDSKIEK